MDRSDVQLYVHESQIGIGVGAHEHVELDPGESENREVESKGLAVNDRQSCRLYDPWIGVLSQKLACVARERDPCRWKRLEQPRRGELARRRQRWLMPCSVAGPADGAMAESDAIGLLAAMRMQPEWIVVRVLDSGDGRSYVPARS